MVQSTTVSISSGVSIDVGSSGGEGLLRISRRNKQLSCRTHRIKANINFILLLLCKSTIKKKMLVFLFFYLILFKYGIGPLHRVGSQPYPNENHTILTIKPWYFSHLNILVIQTTLIAKISFVCFNQIREVQYLHNCTYITDTGWSFFGT